MEKKTYSHILQKVGVLKNFTVAKIVNKKEIEGLKKLVRSMTTDDAEYKKILGEEMKKISDMHDASNPIPGIIYPKDNTKFQKLLFNVTKRFCEGVRNQKMTKRQMAFLITAIINELGLTQEDFMSLKEDLEEDADDEESENSGGIDFGDGKPPKF